MNVYFSGIGGVGIGPLAKIAFDAGYTVAGSDAVESPVSKELKAAGLAVNIGQDGTFMAQFHQNTPIDWFVYTSALPASHPEILLAKKLGLKTTKRDEFLAALIKEKSLKLVAVAGTHGKTTTTGMLVWTLKELGVPVSYSVGSTLSFAPAGAYDPQSNYFIYECDEYDRNFLEFKPDVAVITSFDYDHPDTFPTQESYSEAFKQFLSQAEHVILWQKDASAMGEESAPNRWLLSDDEAVEIALPGAHNRRNATLVLKVVEYLGLGSDAKSKQALALFPGTGRRFEKLADNLFTDYGHHPVEIAATLELARELSEHVVLVYQPHQNQRQHQIKDLYRDQFELAEKVYWVPTYLTREDPNQVTLTPQDLTTNLTNKDSVEFAELNDSLWDSIQRERAAGRLVICMGAGTIDSWVRDQLADSGPSTLYSSK